MPYGEWREVSGAAQNAAIAQPLLNITRLCHDLHRDHHMRFGAVEMCFYEFRRLLIVVNPGS